MEVSFKGMDFAPKRPIKPPYTKVCPKPKGIPDLAKAFAPKEPVKLPPFATGWPKPKGVPDFAKGWPKPKGVPDFASALSKKIEILA